MTDYKRLVTVGGLLIVLLLGSYNYLLKSDINQLLAENPYAQLILATGLETNRIELIGRSIDPNIEYFKWRFENNVVKSYIEGDLMSTSQWKVFNGTKQVMFREIADVNYNYTETEAYIIEKINYFTDSRHTNYIGTLTRIVQIYPNSMKENIIFESDYKKLRLQYFLEADNYNDGQRIDLDKGGNSELNYEDFKLNWTVDKAKVSSAYKYGNGNIQINFKKGEYKIDPILTIGPYKVIYKIAPEVIQNKLIGRKYGATLSYGDLPLIIKVNKDLNLSKGKFKGLFRKLSKGKRHKVTKLSIEQARNVTYDTSEWFSNITFETCFNAVNQTYKPCNPKENGYWINSTEWSFVWEDLPNIVEFKANKWKLINVRANWKPELGTFSDDIMLGINGYPTSDLAWWNTSFTYRRQILNTTSGMTSLIIPVNYSFSDIDSNSNNEMFYAEYFSGAYLYYNDENDTRVANDTDETYKWQTLPAIGSTGTYTDQNNLLRYYPLDNANTDAWDISGNNGNGTLSGSGLTQQSTGQVGYSYDFDGANGYIDTGKFVEKTDSFSIVTWINVDDFPTGSSEIFAEGNTASNNAILRFYIRRRDEGDGQGLINRTVFFIRDNAGGGASVNLYGKSAMNVNQWYQVAMTWDGSNQVLNLYQDGEPIDITVTSNTSLGATTLNTGLIGAFERISVGSYFDGNIDDFRFYTQILTSAEIQAIYNATKWVYLGTEGTNDVVRTVNIVSPTDGTGTEDTTPDVTYNTTGDFSLYSCELLYNQTGYGINNSVLNATNTVYTTNASLSYGVYNLSVECTNGTSSVESGGNIIRVRALMAGNVQDADGNNVYNASVVIIDQNSKTIYGTNSTDANGNWTYEIFDTGNYTVVTWDWNVTTNDGDADPWIEVT